VRLLPNNTEHQRKGLCNPYLPTMKTNPGDMLPRDPSGRYLHLKLKRFESKDDLTMPFARKTWADTPHDAEVDMSPSSRSKCRQCHDPICKGQLRLRLFLQCHKGCKQSTYFHGSSCAWEYPETIKLETINELVGWEKLPEKVQVELQKRFHSIKEKSVVHPVPKKRDVGDVTGEPSQVSTTRKRQKKST